MIESKCPNKKFNGGSRFFAEESIVMSGLCSIAYGAYIGIIIYREKAGRVWPGMLDTDWKETTYRYLIHFFVALPVAIVLFIKLATWPVWL